VRSAHGAGTEMASRRHRALGPTASDTARVVGEKRQRAEQPRYCGDGGIYRKGTAKA